jgi:hypothetical protein
MRNLMHSACEGRNKALSDTCGGWRAAGRGCATVAASVSCGNKQNLLHGSHFDPGVASGFVSPIAGYVPYERLTDSVYGNVKYSADLQQCSLSIKLESSRKVW